MREPTYNGIKTFYAKTRKDWRKWLEKHHASEQSLWLILYNKNSDTTSISYAEAVEEALCFGWIDSKANKRDAESRYQYFAKRKTRSNWSKLNKERVEKMTSAGQMTPAGQAMIDLAKQNGTWTALDNVDALVIPHDLQKEFNKNKKAKAHFDAFPPSAKRMILEWILNAKRPETRAKRIAETVSLAAKNVRANQWKK